MPFSSPEGQSKFQAPFRVPGGRRLYGPARWSRWRRKGKKARGGKRKGASVVIRLAKREFYDPCLGEWVLGTSGECQHSLPSARCDPLQGIDALVPCTPFPMQTRHLRLFSLHLKQTPPATPTSLRLEGLQAPFKSVTCSYCVSVCPQPNTSLNYCEWFARSG